MASGRPRRSLLYAFLTALWQYGGLVVGIVSFGRILSTATGLEWRGIFLSVVTWWGEEVTPLAAWILGLFVLPFHWWFHWDVQVPIAVADYFAIGLITAGAYVRGEKMDGLDEGAELRRNLAAVEAKKESEKRVAALRERLVAEVGKKDAIFADIQTQPSYRMLMRKSDRSEALKTWKASRLGSDAAFEAFWRKVKEYHLVGREVDAIHQQIRNEQWGRLNWDPDTAAQGHGHEAEVGPTTLYGRAIRAAAEQPNWFARALAFVKPYGGAALSIAGEVALYTVAWPFLMLYILLTILPRMLRDRDLGFPVAEMFTILPMLTVFALAAINELFL